MQESPLGISATDGLQNGRSAHLRSERRLSQIKWQAVFLCARQFMSSGKKQSSVSRFSFDENPQRIELNASTASRRFRYLVFCAGHKRNCFPSVRTIAKKCSCSESAVRSAIKELTALGLISKEYCYRENRYGIRQQTSNTYGILSIPWYYENGKPRYDCDDELPF